MYQRILVPVDGSATSGRGLEEAIRMARQSGGQLRLIHVIDELSMSLSMDAYSGFAGDWLGLLREGGQQVLQEAQDTVKAAGVPVDSVLLDNFSAPLHEHVNAEAARWNADLIVLGTHGRRGVGRALLGSSAEQVLRSASVPVLLLRSPEPPAAVPEPAEPAHVTVSLPSAALRVERV